MTLEEAIKRNRVIKQKLIANTNPKLTDIDWVGAIQLGIEALEAYQELRQCTAIDVEDIKPLPSETEE